MADFTKDEIKEAALDWLMTYLYLDGWSGNTPKDKSEKIMIRLAGFETDEDFFKYRDAKLIEAWGHN